MPAPKAKSAEYFPEESSDFDLEGLADTEKRIEAKEIFYLAKGEIASEEDPEMIWEISNQAREEIAALYMGSKHAKRDLPRFDLALAKVTKAKAEIGRSPTLVKNPNVEEVKGLNLHDKARKARAVEIFENGKKQILNSEDKVLMAKILSETKAEWENLYKGASGREREDLHVLNFEFGIFIIGRMRGINDQEK